MKEIAMEAELAKGYEEENEGDAIDPQEMAYFNAFQAMNHILSQDKMHKVFGGKRFNDFTKWVDKQNLA